MATIENMESALTSIGFFIGGLTNEAIKHYYDQKVISREIQAPKLTEKQVKEAAETGEEIARTNDGYDVVEIFYSKKINKFGVLFNGQYFFSKTFATAVTKFDYFTTKYALS